MAPISPSTTTHQVQGRPEDTGANHPGEVKPFVKTRVQHYEGLKRYHEQIQSAKMQHKTAPHNAHDANFECRLTQLIERKFSDVEVVLGTELTKLGRCVENQMKMHENMMTEQHTQIYEVTDCNRYAHLADIKVVTRLHVFTGKKSNTTKIVCRIGLIRI